MEPKQDFRKQKASNVNKETDERRALILVDIVPKRGRKKGNAEPAIKMFEAQIELHRV